MNRQNRQTSNGRKPKDIEPGQYSRKRLKTWEQWAKWAVRLLRAQNRCAEVAADPWRRKVHSLAVALHLAAKLRSVPPKPCLQRPKPKTWEEWAKREDQRLRRKARDAALTPWQKWARAKAVGLCLRRRRARSSA